MSRKFVRSAAAVTAALAVGFGSMGAASAHDASGSLAGLTGGGGSSSLLGGGTLAPVAGVKQDLGDIGGPAWNVQLYATAPAEVAPGQTFTVQVEIQGNKGETRIDEIRQFMPEGFKLQKVERMKDSLLGNNRYTLKAGEYAERPINGETRVSVSWADGMIIPQKPKVDSATPLVVNFTWKAPENVGTYEFRAGANVGALIGGSKDYTAGSPIKVVQGASTGGSLAGGSSEGSLSL